VLKNFDGDISIKIYHPKCDYTNNFLIVINNVPVSTHPFLSQVDWLNIHGVAIHAAGKSLQAILLLPHCQTAFEEVS
jgi:hypothetical protein